jgi:hypothetical protein
MALINIDTTITEALRFIRKSPIKGGVELLSYKRNRTVALIRESQNTVNIREEGYITEETTVEFAELSKTLKGILKREFPRSRKIRFFKFSSPEELLRLRQKI